ncbi:uncharacterized protein LOC144553194 [Carex rostrata]
MPYSYHLKFDIKVVKLANIIDQGLEGKLFMRYYIPTFNNRRIQVDTREIQNWKIVLWDEYASLECNANLDQIEQVMKSSHITFELRWRRTKQVFMARSRLLGSGEISFMEVVNSEAMKLKKWVNLSAGVVQLDESKLPNLLVEMEVQVTKDVGLNEKKCRFSGNDCDCLGCEIDMFHVETLVD